MTVKKVADRCGVTGETLRYYERVGMLPPVTRTAGGIRDYTAEDLKWVGPVLCMRKAGLPPEAIIEYVRLYREGRDLSGFCAADRVVGRAAAMLFVKAGVHAVFAEVMSDGAAALLAAHGIDASCDVRAPQRSRTGKRPAPARWRVPWPGSRTSTRASRRSAAVRRSCARGIDSRPVLCYAPKKAFWEARQWN